MAHVHIKGHASDDAVLLLAAAETLGLPAEVVRTDSDGFWAPQEVADEAGVKYESDDADEPKPKPAKAAEPKPEPVKVAEAPKPAAKKAAAKKAPAKKAAATPPADKE